MNAYEYEVVLVPACTTNYQALLLYTRYMVHGIFTSYLVPGISRSEVAQQQQYFILLRYGSKERSLFSILIRAEYLNLT